MMMTRRRREKEDINDDGGNDQDDDDNDDDDSNIKYNENAYVKRTSTFHLLLVIFTHQRTIALSFLSLVRSRRT